MKYFKVTNWDKFQHYKDRNPPWIKLHYELMSSMDWVTLSDASRVLAVACMLIASRNDGRVPDDQDYVKRVAYLNKAPDFKPLLSCGFLTDYDRLQADASTMQADACSESDSETEAYIGSREIKNRSIEVLDYLNTVTGRNLSLTKNIEACFKREKCSVDDCKMVIDRKWAEWAGKDLQGRVDHVTLWRPANFQVYLDEAKDGPKRKRTSKAPADIKKMFNDIHGGEN